MRYVFALAALAVPAAAFGATSAVEDRYGPAVTHTPPPAVSQAPAAVYAGPFLSWSSKSSTPPVSAPQPAAEPAPAPAAPASLYATPVPIAPAPAPIAVAPPVRTVPTPAPSVPAAPPMQVMAAAEAPTPATPAAEAAATPSTPVHAHFYSLHRDYGDTPDPIAMPVDRPMVLVGPPDLPAQPAGGDSGNSGKASADASDPSASPAD